MKLTGDKILVKDMTVTNVIIDGDIVDILKGKTDVISISGGTVDVESLDVKSKIDIHADDITAKITQSPVDGKLDIGITGRDDGLAKKAVLDIDSPDVVFSPFKVTDADVKTTGPRTEFKGAFVPGVLKLDVPDKEIIINNCDPVPTNGPYLQLYAPGGVFNLLEIDTTTITDAFTAISLASNIPLNFRNGTPSQFIVIQGISDDDPVYILGNSPWSKVEQGFLAEPMEYDEDGKPIKLSGF